MYYTDLVHCHIISGKSRLENKQSGYYGNDLNYMEDKAMSQLQTPFRYDYVGSFLRPAKLKKARRQFDKGNISYEK